MYRDSAATDLWRGDTPPSGTPALATWRGFYLFVIVGSAVLAPEQPSSSSDYDGGSAFALERNSQAADHVADLLAPLGVQWGRADAIPVSADTIAKARTLLNGLPTNFRYPHLAPSEDGEIGLSWSLGKDRFEAMLQPDDHLVWVMKVAGKFVAGDDVIWSRQEGRDRFYASLGRFYGTA